MLVKFGQWHRLDTLSLLLGFKDTDFGQGEIAARVLDQYWSWADMLLSLLLEHRFVNL